MTPPERRAPWPARQGVTWLRESFGLLSSQPLRLLVIGLVLQLLAGLSQVGLLGLFFLLAMPALSAGVLQAMQTTRQGERPRLGSLFLAFSRPPVLGRLVLLGMLGLACAVISVAVGLGGFLGDLDPALLARLEAGETAAVAELDPAVLQGVLLSLGAGMFLAGTLAFYAIPLLWFSDLGLWHAIARGIAGMLREWRALLVLGLLLGGLSVPVVALLGGFLVMGAGASTPVTLFMLLVTVLFQLLLFAAQYLSFADIFGAPAPPGPAQAEGQLVA